MTSPSSSGSRTTTELEILQYGLDERGPRLEHSTVIPGLNTLAGSFAVACSSALGCPALAGDELDRYGGATAALTSDGGRSWGRGVAVSIGTVAALGCIPGGACVAVFVQQATSQPVITRSANGIDWTVARAAIPARSRVSDVGCAKPDLCAAVGTVGNVPAILVSHDAGASWSPAAIAG